MFMRTSFFIAFVASLFLIAGLTAQAAARLPLGVVP